MEIFNSKSIPLIIDTILDHKNRGKEKFKLELYENSFQKWVTRTTLSTYALSIILAITFSINRVAGVELATLLSLTVTLLGAYLMILTGFWGIFKEMKNPLKTFFKGFNVMVQKELPLLNRLCLYNKSELEFFSGRLKVDYEGRGQIIKLVCGMSPMGLVFATITTLLSLSDFSKHFGISSHITMYIGFILFSSYFTGFFSVLFRLRLEKYQFLIMYAASLHDDSEKKHGEKQVRMAMEI